VLGLAEGELGELEGVDLSALGATVAGELATGVAEVDALRESVR